MKKPLLSILLIFISTYIFAQPANNLCASAVDRPSTAGCTTTAGTLYQATATGSPAASTCGGTTYDVWYRFTTNATNNSYRITVAGFGASLNATNTFVEVYNANSCAGVTLANTISCSDMQNGGLYVGNLSNTTTYYFRVYTTTNPTAGISSAWAFTVCVTPAEPANDACANSVFSTQAASCTPTSAGNLFGAKVTNGLTSTCGTAYDVWYRFTTANTDGVTSYRINVTGLGAGLTGTNTFIEVFSATQCLDLSIGRSMGCSNVSAGGATFGNFSKNTTYYFRIFTTTNPIVSPNTRYNFTVCVMPVAPSNDGCATATVLTPGVTNTWGTVSGATTSGVATPCGGDAADDVWYRFQAPYSYATVTLSFVGAGLASSGVTMQLYSGACGSLTQVGPCNLGKLMMDYTGLTAGAYYYVRVYSTGAAAITGSNSIFNIAVTPSSPVVVGSGRMREVFKQVTLSAAQGLLDPWEVTYAKDTLWVTESKGARVYKIHPVTGKRDTILNLSNGSTFFASPNDTFNIGTGWPKTPQGGMAGLALHPNFMDGTANEKNYVYISYVRKYIGKITTPVNDSSGSVFQNMLARFTYNKSTGKLTNPVRICDSIPGSSDHNSQRIIIAPVNDTMFLFYAAGDMGAGQFDNKYRTQKSQVPLAYEGKILRFHTEPETSGADEYQKWIPNSNPNPNSAVWAVGIRNNQGFAYDSQRNILYGSSHGPYSDDEINIIERGRNYGHPLVIGFAADENYAGSSAGAPYALPPYASTCPMITSEVSNANAIGTSYKDPLFSAYAAEAGSTTDPGTIRYMWRNNPGNGGWPSEGWTGMDIYKGTAIPGWKNSILISSLKWGRILRLKTDSAGTSVIETGTEDTISYFGSTNRFRDMTLSANGRDMYVVMDRSTTTSGPSAANPVITACPGCVQKYSFLGYNDDGTGKSTLPIEIPVEKGTPNVPCRPGTPVTIDNDNNNLWVPITGPDGNIVAELKANGQNLGLITSSFYTRTGVSRSHLTNRYLNRNFTITPAVQPTSAVDIRLYISTAEFEQLKTDLGGTLNMTDLIIMKNQDTCGSAIQSTTTAVTMPGVQKVMAHGTTGYVLRGSVNSFSSFYVGRNLIILPLKLLNFTGILENNATQLKWKTAQEENTSHFAVERSVDGTNFVAIGSVTALGNTGVDNNYNYADNDVYNLQANIVYYRLKMVDVDGQFIYSNVITVSLNYVAGKVNVMPNPVKTDATVTVTVATPGKMLWKLVDNSGKTILSNTVELRKGINTLPLPMQKLAAGIYYLQVTAPGITDHVKIQKL